MTETINVRLHVLSPVHIGCGDEYEPMTFVINPDTKKLICFDIFQFVKKLDKDQVSTFTQIAGKGNLVSIIELYRFIFSHRSKIKGHEVELPDAIIDRYLKVKELPLRESALKQELNNFRIPRTAYNPLDNLPYIPGSSLKGSVKTGYLSMLAYAGGTPQGIVKLLAGETPASPITGQKDARKLEQELLGGAFDADPFRLVKVSDFLPAENVRTKILYGVNRKKDEVKSGRGVPQILETIMPGSVFRGVINIESPVNGSGIGKPVKKDVLFRLAQKHYIKNYDRERNLAKKIEFSTPRAAETQKAIQERGNRPYLIRLGHHSGAESVTIEGNRKITIRGPRGTKSEKDSATTIWLSSENDKPINNAALIPFGWTMLEVEK